MWLTVIIALPLTASVPFLPETFESTILRRKAEQLRISTGDWSIHCLRDKVPVDLRIYLVKPWTMLLREPVLMVVALAFTLDYGIQSLTYSAVPAAFLMPRGWNEEPAAWALNFTVIGASDEKSIKSHC